MSDLIMISASKDDFLKNRRDEILTSIEKVVEKSVLLSPSDIKTEEEIAIADTQFEEHSEAPMIIPSDVQTDSETVEKSDKETDERNIPEVGKLDVYINKSLEEALDTGRQHIQKTWKEAAEGSKKCDRKYREKLLPSILKKAYIKQFDKSFPEKLKNPNPEIAVTVGGKPKIVTFKNNKPVYTFKRPTLPINSIPPVGSRELLHNGIDVEPNSNPTTSTTAMDTDVTPDLVGFLRKWTKDHKIPMPALNCLLKFLRLFPSMDFLPADAKKVLGSPEFNDSPQAKLLNLIETKFEKVFSRLTSVENNHKLMTNTMNVLMESVGSSSAQPSKRPKLQIEIGRAAPTTEEATSSEITLPLSSLVDMRKFNQLLCSKNFYEEMIEKYNTPDIMNLNCVDGIVAGVVSKMLTSNMIRQHNISGRKVSNSAGGSSKTAFSNYLNIVMFIQDIVLFQVKHASPSTVYTAISCFLKRSAEKRKYNEEN